MKLVHIYIYIWAYGMTTRAKQLKHYMEMTDYQSFKLGGSIKVPFVQELAKEPLSKLPSRYARPRLDEPATAELVTTKEFPVIN